MHSRRMKRWQKDQRCIFEIMTDARKIKIFLRWVYFWEVAWERRSELLKAAGIMSARGKRWTLLSYLFSFPIPLSTFCSSREYSHPGEENSSYLAKKTVLFSRRLGKRANFAFMDHQKKRSTMHIVHCQCIKDLHCRQLRQNGC